MAHGIQLDRERFRCPLCLDLFNEPVSLPCSHCYCMHCINKHLDHEEESGIYLCPECRHEYVSRPLLVRNSVLAFVLDELKKTDSLQDHSGDSSEPKNVWTGSPNTPPAPVLEGVVCDLCLEVKRKAVKSCMQCVASYCEDHLQPHFDVPPLRKHKLVAATAELENSVCSRHHEIMKLFCRTDQTCICYLCSKDEHRGHEKVSATAERNERQRELEGARKKIHFRIKAIEKDIKVFQQEENGINVSANALAEHTEKVFAELVRAMEKNLSNIREKTKARQKSELSQFQKLREKEQQQIVDLMEKETLMEKLSHTEDPISFLTNYPSLSTLANAYDPATTKIRQSRHFEKIPAVVSEARERILDVIEKECAKILTKISGSGGQPAIPQRQIETVDVPDSQSKTRRTSELPALNGASVSKAKQLKGDIPAENEKLRTPGLFGRNEPDFSKARKSVSSGQGKDNNLLSAPDSHVLNGSVYAKVGKKDFRDKGVGPNTDNAPIPHTLSQNGFSFPHAKRRISRDNLEIPPGLERSRPTDPHLPSVEGSSRGKAEAPQINADFEINYDDILFTIDDPRRDQIRQISAEIASRPKPNKPDDVMPKSPSPNTRGSLGGAYAPKPQDGSQPDPGEMSTNNISPRPRFPKTRSHFLQHACQVVLDPSTANPHLVISKENRKAVYVSEELRYPVLPQRFAYSWQVLSQDSLPRRCYLEVERSGRGVLVAVAYGDISRSGMFAQCTFGQNDKSWALDCYKNSYEFRHNGAKIPIQGTWSSRVGVFVDQEVGLLAFYSVAENMTLLHKVQTKFTQPLYAGLWLSDGAAAEVSKLK